MRIISNLETYDYSFSPQGYCIGSVILFGVKYNTFNLWNQIDYNTFLYRQDRSYEFKCILRIYHQIFLHCSRNSSLEFLPENSKIDYKLFIHICLITLDIIYLDICSPDEFIFLIIRTFNYVTDKVNCVQLMWMMIMNLHVAPKDVWRTNLDNVFRNIFGILSSFFKQCFYKPSYLCECIINIFATTL